MNRDSGVPLSMSCAQYHEGSNKGGHAGRAQKEVPPGLPPQLRQRLPHLQQHAGLWRGMHKLTSGSHTTVRHDSTLNEHYTAPKLLHQDFDPKDWLLVSKYYMLQSCKQCTIAHCTQKGVQPRNWGQHVQQSQQDSEQPS